MECHSVWDYDDRFLVGGKEIVKELLEDIPKAFYNVAILKINDIIKLPNR